jgi:hypothetical protein
VRFCHLQDEAGELVILQIAEFEGFPEFLHRSVLDIKYFIVSLGRGVRNGRRNQFVCCWLSERSKGSREVDNSTNGVGPRADDSLCGCRFLLNRLRSLKTRESGRRWIGGRWEGKGHRRWPTPRRSRWLPHPRSYSRRPVIGLVTGPCCHRRPPLERRREAFLLFEERRPRRFTRFR